MNMNYNCPVCNKSGLPDYRIQETVCPQCNSDLKPYLILNSIERGTRRYVRGILALAVVLSVITLLLYLMSVNKKDKMIDDNLTNLGIANDSINSLNRMINQYELNQLSDSSPAKSITFIYQVKSGDNLGKIAKLFFNDYRMYEKIAEDNNLNKPYLLAIGQPLTIKIEQ
jgi:hypothetical protein